MSVTDATSAPPPRPAPAMVRKPCPPFRPAAFVLGAVGTAAPLVGQYDFERSAVPWLATVAALGRPLFSWGPVDVSPLGMLEILATSPSSPRPPWSSSAGRCARSTPATTPPSSSPSSSWWQVYYGVLESFPLPAWLAALTGGWITVYSPTFVTIVAAIGTELVLGRLAYGKWINPASADVTGISAGILIKSPELWPFLLSP